MCPTFDTKHNDNNNNDSCYRNNTKFRRVDNYSKTYSKLSHQGFEFFFHFYTLITLFTEMRLEIKKKQLMCLTYQFKKNTFKNYTQLTSSEAKTQAVGDTLLLTQI